jgi:site-specific recombinase XerD
VDLHREIDRFLSSARFADATRRSYKVDLAHFARWLAARHLRLEDLGVRELTEYAAELGRGRSRLAPASIARRLAAVRSFLRTALGPERVPDAALAPRRSRRLPDPPPAAEIEQALDDLEGDGPLALRNRALVELVYSAGLRSAEAVGLDLGDVDFDQELIRVRGKGG